MIYIGYLIFLFVLIRLLVALVNAITNIYLPKTVSLKKEPLISILIPARNEENTIGNLLSDIQKLTYKNYEVYVYNDLSTDKTNDVIKQFSCNDKRIHLLQGIELEKDWLGKNFACYQLSKHAKGKYFLFVDADVRIQNKLLQKTVSLMLKQKLGLLSIFPKQILDNKGAWLSVPLMNSILLSLLPLILVRLSAWVSFSAANGQFMLFNSSLYKNLQPHLYCKNQKVEDIAICKYYKKRKLKVSTLLGNDDIQCKMYASLNEAITGFSKNVFAFFGNSILVTFLFAFITTLSPIVTFLVFDWKLMILYILLLILLRIFISYSSQQSISRNVYYMPIQQIIFIRIILRALIKQKNKSLHWKGRKIE